MARPNKPEESQTTIADRDAERALVGAVLTLGHIPSSVSYIEKGDFFLLDLALLWERAQELQKEGGHLDVITMARSESDSSSLIKLINSAPNSQHVEDYAAKVRDSSARRRVLEIASAMAKGAFSDKPLEVIRGQASRALEDWGTAIKTNVSHASDVASSLWEELDDMRGGQSIILTSPWTSLDNLIGGIMDAELCLVAGRPGIGKTQFALQWADYHAEQGKRVLVHALEPTEEQVVRRLSLSAAQVDWMKFRRNSADHQDIYRLATEYARRMSNRESGLYIVDEIMSVERFYALARDWASQVGGLSLVVIDYAQKYPVKGRDGSRPDILYGEIAETLKRLAKELRCPVISTVQLHRFSDPRPPVMTDIRESGRFEQEADLILGIYRPWYYSVQGADRREAQVHVLKSRDGAADGRYASLVWTSEYVTFSDRDEQTRGMVRPELGRTTPAQGVSVSSDAQMALRPSLAGSEPRPRNRGMGTPAQQALPQGRGEAEQRSSSGMEGSPDQPEDDRHERGSQGAPDASRIEEAAQEAVRRIARGE